MLKRIERVVDKYIVPVVLFSVFLFLVGQFIRFMWETL